MEKLRKNLAQWKSLNENGFLCDDEKSQKQAIFNFVAQNRHELACLRKKSKLRTFPLCLTVEVPQRRRSNSMSMAEVLVVAIMLLCQIID